MSRADRKLTSNPWHMDPVKTGNIIIIMMIPTLLVDCITGWMSINAPFSLSLSQIYRSVMLLVLFLWLAVYWRRGAIPVLFALLVTFCLMAIHSISASDIASVGMDFRFNLSLLAHFIYFVFLLGFINKIKKNRFALQRTMGRIDLIVRFSFYVIAFNIVLGIFGIGYSTLASYAMEAEESGAGGKGFFVAGNDLSSVVLIVGGMLLIKQWSVGKIIPYIYYSVVLLLLSVLLLTKTVILGTLVLIIGIPIAMSAVIERFRLRYRPLIPLFLGVLLALATITWLIATDSAIVRRIVWLAESQDVLVAITTGRSNFIAAALQLWFEIYSVTDWLFGKGWSEFQLDMKSILGYEKMVEIDYADVLMMNGLFGLMVVGLIWFVYLYSAFAHVKWTPVGKAVLFVDVLLLGLAATAGHILFSAMNGMFVALLNILPILHSKMREHK